MTAGDRSISSVRMIVLGRVGEVAWGSAQNDWRERTNSVSAPTSFPAHGHARGENACQTCVLIRRSSAVVPMRMPRIHRHRRSACIQIRGHDSCRDAAYTRLITTTSGRMSQ